LHTEATFRAAAGAAPSQEAELVPTRIDLAHSLDAANWIEAIVRAPILPTVLPIGVEHLCQFARCLHEEGYPALEILARPLEAAIHVFEQISTRPERQLLRWGLGTLRSERDAAAAVAVKPDFLVSPAFSRRVLQVAVQANIPYIPAVQTFQDVQNVLDAFDEHGLEVKLLKLCPVFGLTRQYVEAMCGCFPGIMFCPTGEVLLDNYIAWKSIPGIVAPMGSEFVPRAMLESNDIATIRSRLKQIRQLADIAAS
jgi:2-dehydro-3-deoxyphosphogluconate aldolase/(4S)-4-hydroxy-2-oxoglutarate aldolase